MPKDSLTVSLTRSPLLFRRWVFTLLQLTALLALIIDRAYREASRRERHIFVIIIYEITLLWRKQTLAKCLGSFLVKVEVKWAYQTSLESRSLLNESYLTLICLPEARNVVEAALWCTTTPPVFVFLADQITMLPSIILFLLGYWAGMNNCSHNSLFFLVSKYEVVITDFINTQ